MSPFSTAGPVAVIRSLASRTDGGCPLFTVIGGGLLPSFPGAVGFGMGAMLATVVGLDWIVDAPSDIGATVFRADVAAGAVATDQAADTTVRTTSVPTVAHAPQRLSVISFQRTTVPRPGNEWYFGLSDRSVRDARPRGRRSRGR